MNLGRLGAGLLLGRLLLGCGLLLALLATIALLVLAGCEVGEPCDPENPPPEIGYCPPTVVPENGCLPTGEGC
jgi:hypothetical protein